MSKKDSKLNTLTMKEGEYPVGKPFYYCPTGDCGECHDCTTGKKLDEMVRPDLNDEEFEEHLENSVKGEAHMVAAGSLRAAGNGRSYQFDDLIRPFFKPGISRRPMLPIGNNWLHKSLITGGGFRRGELAMISAGVPNPLNRFKSNWLANYLSDFVARGPKPVDERSILQLFAEPEVTGNDFYHRLRSLVNAGLPIHTVRIPGGTRPEKIVRYTGSTDHSTFIPDNVRRMVRTVDTSPFIGVKDWGIWVGGKKICTMPLSMRDMVVDSVTSRWQTRGQYGAYGQVTLDCPTGVYEHATEWLTVGREEWAEEAIDRLIYNRVYGVPHQMVKNGSYIADQLWGLRNSNVQFVKQQARERLRAASNPERQKRGY